MVTSCSKNTEQISVFVYVCMGNKFLEYYSTERLSHTPSMVEKFVSSGVFWRQYTILCQSKQINRQIFPKCAGEFMALNHIWKNVSYRRQAHKRLSYNTLSFTHSPFLPSRLLVILLSYGRSFTTLPLCYHFHFLIVRMGMRMKMMMAGNSHVKHVQPTLQIMFSKL